MFLQLALDFINGKIKLWSEDTAFGIRIQNISHNRFYISQPVKSELLLSFPNFNRWFYIIRFVFLKYTVNV